jgi:hypothetical protein
MRVVGVLGFLSGSPSIRTHLVADQSEPSHSRLDRYSDEATAGE